MNFLAHLYLSQNPPELMVGNFIGDFVKGRAFETYPDTIQKGIILHREIDAFTDDNILVRQSKKRLVPKYRHFSAVIVDMFYDHFLATLWKDFHQQSLESFAEDSYATIQKFYNLLPEKAQYMFPFMVKHNWLTSYRTSFGLNRALTGLSQRTRYTSHMEEATVDLEHNYEDYKKEFSAFFPILIDHVTNWKKENLNL